MKQSCKKSLALFLTLAMLASMFTFPVFAMDDLDSQTEIIYEDTEDYEEPVQEEDGDIGVEQNSLEILTASEPVAEPFEESPTGITVTAAGYTIESNGIYQLAAGSTGTVTMAAEVTEVTLIGNYATWDTSYTMTSIPFTNLHINCVAAEGITLILQDIHIENRDDAAPVVDFRGVGNQLDFEGVSVIDNYGSGQGTYAAIHVALGTELTVGGTGTLYFYKSSGGAGFGANTSEANSAMNGDITFGEAGTTGPTIFAKGTKQGALIGAGASGSSTVDAGEIRFLSGEYNLITNSRGAAIGGSAGGSGATKGNVFVFGKDASVNINVDYSGSAVGGGGYDGGNDAAGGIAYFNGGSVRVYVDANAAGNTSWGQLRTGINDIPITAAKRDSKADNNPVYKLVFDTTMLDTPATNFAVLADGEEIFSGGLHGYYFVQEGLDKGEQLSISSTVSNWRPNNDTCLYLYLTGENHTLTVNGEEFEVTFDQDVVGSEAEHTTGPFTVKKIGNPASLVWDGTLDFRWYDESNLQAEYHITTPAQWAALAWICSEHLSDLSDYGTNTAGNVIDVYGDIPTTQDTFGNVQFYLDNDIDMGGVYNSSTQTWSGPNYYPVGSQGFKDNSTANFYGSFYGRFDGQGHIISNIYCNRGTGQNSQSVGLFGRLGAADNVIDSHNDIIIENVAITGYIKAGRSVGGIVGKTLDKSNDNTIIIRNCVNFASVNSTDSKGVGGIAGALWNSASIYNCFNAGDITDKYSTACNAGIAGDNDGKNYIYNSYNIGTIDHDGTDTKVALGTIVGNNSAKTEHVVNCYYLEDCVVAFSTIVAGSVYNPRAGIVYYGTEKTAAELKSAEFLDDINGGGDAWAFAQSYDSIYKLMDGMSLAGYPVPAVFATAEVTVTFSVSPSTASVEVKDSDNLVVAPTSGNTYTLTKDGVYTYAISAANYTSQTNSFTADTDKTISVTLIATGGTGGNSGTGTPGVDTSGLNLTSTTWDGKTVDVSWYIGSEGSSSYTLGTAAELAGAAAIVNGLVNENCKVYTGSEVIDAAVWNNSAYVLNSSGSTGSNNRATDDYSYGVEDFNGKTIYLDANLNMSAGNYMPLGGQYLMKKNDSSTKIGSSFCGVFDGDGHSVTINCDRHCSTGDYGDGSSVGLIGRLGVHDDDPASLRPSGAAVRNVAVYGNVKGNRSVGGVVGKVGKTNGGATIEDCANFATVSNTDAKGVGGIVGAGWNGDVIRNCYNAGSISSTYACPIGGISGSNEMTIENCYNIGTISGSYSSYAMAIGTNNGGAPYDTHVNNCYYLEGSAPGGGYYSGSKAYNDGSKTAAELKSGTILNALGSAFAADTKNINQGYPVLAWQNPGATTGTGTGTAAGATEQQVITGKPVDIATKVEDGKVTGTAGAAAVMDAVEAAIKAVEEAKTKGETNVVAEVTLNAKVENAEGVTSVEILVPVSALNAATARDDIILAIASDIAVITFDSATLGGALTGAANGAMLKIIVEVLDESALSEEQKKIVGDNLAIDLSVFVGNTQIRDFKGIATVTAPYTPPVGIGSEDYDLLTVYYIDDSGNIQEMAGTVYDPAKETLTFTTTHFSVFFASEWINPFTDVQKGAWFYKSMRFAYSNGLMNGMTESTFAPSMDLTRAMLVAMLYRYEGEPAVTEASKFSDVESGQWYTNAIVWASENGIVDGYGNGLFGTNDSVTREQIATILMRYAEGKNLDTKNSADLSSYSDTSEISNWAEDAMQWVNAEMLITGRTADTLAPKDTATRAEVATILQRLIERDV